MLPSSGSSTLSRPVSEKAPDPIVINDSGIETLFRLLHPSESVKSDRSYRIRNRHARQTAAVREGITPNAGDAVGYAIVTVLFTRRILN